ncbi:MAG: histidine kinase N-terminal 7TM domain-containing protein, partial [Candidatus Hodarchaeales archaeon]
VSEYFFNPWALPYFLAALASLIIIFVLVYKAEKTPAIRLFTGAQISNLIVSLTAALATSVGEGHPDLWILWMNINGFFGVLTGIFFFHFSFSYLNENKFLPNNKIILIYFIPVINFIFRSLFYFRNIQLSEQSYYGLYDVQLSELETSLYFLHYGLVAGFLILAAFNFFRMFRSKEMKLKQISGYFILASLIPLVALTIVLLIFFISPDISLKFELTNLSTVFSNLIIGYGISKKELFNINNILKKRIIPYALTNFFLTWVLILTKEAINHIFAEAFFGGIKELSMGLMILLFVPIHDVSHYITSKLLPEEATHHG